MLSEPVASLALTQCVSSGKSRPLKADSAGKNLIIVLIWILSLTLNSSYTQDLPFNFLSSDNNLHESDNSKSHNPDLKSDVICFDFNKYDLKPESIPYLDKIADEMKLSSDAKLEIIGHSDNIGSFDYNLDLSKRRAFAVAEYLISKGCNIENIITVGLGFSEPVSSNNSSLGRTMNRRVEFLWLSPPIVEIEEYESNGILKEPDGNVLTGEFTVTDKKGEPYTDLKEEDLSAVLKWKQSAVGGEIEDSTRGNVHLIPIDEMKKTAFALTLDYSPSMYDMEDVKKPPKNFEKINSMEIAVMNFIDRMNENCFAKLIKFGGKIDVIQNYTNDVNVLRNAVRNQSFPRISTALFLSIYNALQDTTFNYDPTFMKTVIAFTDGEDNSSGKITKENIITIANEKGVRIYTIGMLDLFKHSDPPGMNGSGEKDLCDIASRTGGLYYYSPDEKDLSSIYTNIINQIKNSYTVSIIWNQEKLPPKNTPVKAIVTINIKGQLKHFTKDYVYR